MKKRPFFCAAIALVPLHAAPAQCQQITIQTETGKQTVLAKVVIESLPHC
jgi:hypothetical protein